MEKDQELYEQLETLFSQLAIFVYETGFWDVGYSNIPLLINSDIPRIALVDLNDLFDEDPVNFSAYQKDGIQGLLERLHKSFHQAIVNSAAKHSGSTVYEIMQERDNDQCTYDSIKHKYQCKYKPYSFKDVYLIPVLKLK